MRSLSRTGAITWWQLAIAVVLVAGGAAQLAAARGAVDLGVQTVELQLLTPWGVDHPLSAPVADLVEQFNADNTGRAVVVVDAIVDREGYERRLLGVLADGSLPDVFVLQADGAVSGFPRSERLMDLSTELERGWAGTFLPGAVEAVGVGRGDGAQLAVPFEYRLSPVWYHDGVLKAAGVGAFPRSAGELAAAVTRLRAAGVAPAEVGEGAASASLWFSYLAVSAAGRAVWDLTLTDPRLAPAATTLRLLYPVAGDNGYESGRVATTVRDERAVAPLRDSAAAVHAASRWAPAPALAEQDPFLIGSPVSALAAAASEDARRSAATLNLVRWLTLPANALLLTERSGSMFATRYPAVRNVDPMLAELIRATRDARFVALPFASAHPEAPFAEAFGDLVSGRLDPTAFLRALAGDPS